MRTYLDFEKPVAELESRVDELHAVSADDDDSSLICEEISRLEGKINSVLEDLYAKLTPWQKTQVSRHPGRPRFSHYVRHMISDFMPLSGDRKFADDCAIEGGLGRFRGQTVVIMGHERGGDTQSRLKHNFGMAQPEGYRKAARLMELADHFDVPLIVLVDTAGAYPGIGAEERGQAEAIARSTESCLRLHVPNIAVIIGQGGSGGAVAIATASKTMMLEHAIYTVASPEAAASILWRDSGRAVDAATSMKITAQDLLRLGVVDEVLSEPLGGAHRNVDEMVAVTERAIASALQEFAGMDREDVRRARKQKFMEIGMEL